MTALWDGFDPVAEWIWAGPSAGSSKYYALLRHVLTVADQKPTVAKAILFITAWVEPTMLSAYKLYVDGVLMSLGPGRGEANVMTGDSTFRHAPYVTVDVTSALRRRSVIAVAGMAPLFSSPCNLHA